MLIRSIPIRLKAASLSGRAAAIFGVVSMLMSLPGMNLNMERAFSTMRATSSAGRTEGVPPPMSNPCSSLGSGPKTSR